LSDKSGRSNVLVTIGLVAILALAIGGFMLYNLLFPTVWAETLNVKNSTGHFDVITHYRNATDISYSDLKAFLDAENASLKAAIDCDCDYRPVEYAIMLHNDAQRKQINCSLLPLGINDGYPDHVIVAFNTNDSGMIYVDPTGTNVSAADYPGIDYGRIVFLRDQWNHTLPVADGSNRSITVREYRNTRPVSYSELVYFLAGDDTERTSSLENDTSADFAVRLHNNAEAMGLANAIVCVSCEESTESIYFNAFATTDNGVVYIDDRSVRATDLRPIFKPHDNVVYLAIGSLLGELPVEQISGNLDYDFYQGKSTMMTPYRSKISAYVQDKAVFESDLEEYNKRAAANNDSYYQYLSERMQLDAEMDHYSAEDQNGSTDRANLIDMSRALDNKLIAYLYNNSLLELEKRSLDERKSDLDLRQAELVNAEENRWLSACAPVLVKDFTVYW
jgi:hypothetical protein